MTKYILFDLDGTLTDPEEGITKSLQYALRHMGIEIDDLTTLRRHIGPPLKEGLMEYWGLDEEKTEAAILWYREYFAKTGMYQNIVYPGVEKVLEALVAEGKKLILATSKAEKFAILIMEHFGLDKYFSDMCGASLDGLRGKKADVIHYALEKNQIRNKDEVIMVGDRLHDIAGAKENGIKSIGVLYGFGDREELELAGADKIAQDMEELKHILLLEI
jgi:phosphoglycolate phosphatase